MNNNLGSLGNMGDSFALLTWESLEATWIEGLSLFGQRKMKALKVYEFMIRLP